jgi:hypothetical protein
MTAQRPAGAGVSKGCRISPVWSSDRISVTACVSLDGRACAGWVPLARMGGHYSPSLIASEAAGRLNSDELIEVEIDDGLERSASSWGSASRTTGTSGASRQKRSPSSRRKSGTGPAGHGGPAYRS